MDTIVWLIVLATGLLVAVMSSRWSVGHLIEFAAGTRIPAFVIGITFVSIGTDLPEMANSVVASVTGHGDINVGDSIGSAMVQSTLILGLLPILAGTFPLARDRVRKTGLATVGALTVGAALMSDGALSRLDATVLIAVWVVGTALMWRGLPEETARLTRLGESGSAHHLPKALFGLVLVGLGATTAVQAVEELAVLWSLPEYLVATVLASLGTSLPELAVELNAIKRGQWDLAVGDAIGSSFVDATVSLGVGPLITPIVVTIPIVALGSLVAAAVIGVSVLVLVQREEHSRVSGTVLIGVFVLGYLLITSLS